MLRLGEAVDGPHPSVEVSLDPVYSVVLQAAPGGKVEWVLPELKRRGIIY
jgi:hypothetical protein